jgi:polysaccharide biosynthesis transport protein
LKAQIEVTEKELKGLTANQQRILRDLERYQRRIERFPVSEQEMAQITRDYEMSKTNYKSLLDKKTAAEMALDMERRQQAERFIVLDRARLPVKPVKPARPLLYAGGSVIGLVVALLLGFIAELRQNVILGEWELKDDIPVLARLPQFEVLGSSSQTASPPA